MRRLLLLAASVAGLACSGSQSGTAGGREDRWTLPLVGPLEEGPLLTAVTINTHGPYVFAIDPDAPVSVIDAETVKAAELTPVGGVPRLDETGAAQQRVYAAMIALEIGTLIVERTDAIIVRTGLYDTVGRRVHGVLGRDVFGDAAVFGIDRDQGVVHLVGGRFERPANAIELPYRSLPRAVAEGQGAPVPRHVVAASINGQALAMHVDLGTPLSQLREPKWSAAGLVPRDVQLALVDEVGTPRRIARASEPTTIRAGGLSASGIVFVPYDDRRFPATAVDGTLGLAAFAAHDVWQDARTRAFFVVPRAPVATPARIARWDDAVLQRCKASGCITARLVDPLNGAAPAEGKPHPGIVLSLTRDEIAGGMGLEVMLAARGQPGLPRLVANLPPHVDRLIHHLKPEFVGQTLEVVDASPFPRRCPGSGGCVDQVALTAR